MTIYTLLMLLSQFWTSLLFHVWFHVCFLSCIQVSQDTGKVVWYCLGWPRMAWLIASLSYASPFATTRLWSRKEFFTSLFANCISFSLLYLFMSFAYFLIGWLVCFHFGVLRVLFLMYSTYQALVSYVISKYFLLVFLSPSQSLS